MVRHLGLVRGFLMHRVELKELRIQTIGPAQAQLVPNAPCGVERWRLKSELQAQNDQRFLMHRVELKAAWNNCFKGVFFSFLMHRVELKDSLFLSLDDIGFWFLMHRVELKDYNHRKYIDLIMVCVPNAPCGVERLKI